MNKARIGIIGVGLMGHGIAKNIVAKGWPLRFLDHPGNQPSEDLIALGAEKVADKHALAADCDVLLLCVSGTPQVEDVLLGDTGILAGIRPGLIVIDCSTAIPASTEAIAARAEAAGARFVDAAMTRTPIEAEAGRLNLLVGAAPEVLDEIRPLLSAFAENIFHAGAPGAGHKLKLLHNFVSLGMATLISEAAACALEGGITPEVFTDALAKGGGYGAGLDRIGPYLLEGDASKLKFFVANAHKDLSYYGQMARDSKAPHAVADGIAAALQSLMDSGHANDFMGEAPRFFRELAGRD